MSDITLREHIDQRFSDLERRIHDMREADQRALQLALDNSRSSLATHLAFASITVAVIAVGVLIASHF